MNGFEETWFELRRDWSASLVIVFLVASVIALAVWQGSQIAAQGEPHIATITAFSNVDTAADPGKIGVYAVSGEGFRGYARVTLDRVKGCKIGDTIKAELLGTRLRLHPRPCTGTRP